MSYDVVGFGSFFLDVIKGKPTSLNSYNVNLRKIDKAVDGVDELLAAGGPDALIAWLKDNAQQFAPYDSSVKSAANAYLRFKAEQSDESEELDTGTPEQNATSIFKYENELQEAVRAQLAALEPGMFIDDDGTEAALATGRADILGRDAQGRAVVIELKAGVCPKGAIEQVLGYAQDRIDQGEASVRAILIASGFTPRQRAATKLIPGLELRTYRLAVKFDEVA